MNAGVSPRSRLPNVGVSIFAVMTRLANEHGGINLSQGFPDFDCAPELVTLVRDWLGRGQNQYAPMAGVPALRVGLARTIATLYGAQYDPDSEITVTAGATEALFAAITALVHPARCSTRSKRHREASSRTSTGGCGWPRSGTRQASTRPSARTWGCGTSTRS